MAAEDRPGYLDPFAVVGKIALGRLEQSAGVGFAAHQAKAYVRAVAEAGDAPDYSGWLTVKEYADVLGVGYRTCWALVKRHVNYEKVAGRVLISPEAAADYKWKHDITRRPPRAGSG